MSKRIAIVDYGLCNLSSVKNAFEHLGEEPLLTCKPEVINDADIIILPGVGSFGEAMMNLKELALVDVLTKQVCELKKPFLGICLGMQLLASDSNENGFNEGLGWVKGSVKRIDAAENLRLPHIGWNDLTVDDGSPLFNGLGPDWNFYFVHSYRFECEAAVVDAYCNYGEKITAAIRQENIFATQFHPEKSHSNGLKLLENFLHYSEQYI